MVCFGFFGVCIIPNWLIKVPGHFGIHLRWFRELRKFCQNLVPELIQTSPDHNNKNKSIGRIQIIDLDLSKYDQLATRFDVEHQEGKEFLKGGIETKNKAFNRLISQIEKVAIRSQDPMLLTGPTGAGKSQLATRIFQLKKKRSMLKGTLVSVTVQP